MRGERTRAMGGALPVSPAISRTPGTIFMVIAGRLRGPQGALDQLGGGGGDGQDHLLDVVAGGGRLDVVHPAHHGDAEEGQSVGAGVVVEDGHRHEPGLGIAEHVADDGGPGVTAADHGHPESRATRSPLPGEEPRVEAQAAHGHGPEDAAHDDHDEGDDRAPGRWPGPRGRGRTGRPG